MVKNGPTVTALVQAAYHIENEETRTREIEALKQAGEELQCQNGLIITRDQEEVLLDTPSMTIAAIPFWKWTLVFKTALFGQV